MYLKLFWKNIIILVGLLGSSIIFASSLPANSKIIEAEDYFMKDSNFRSVSNVHVSAGNYIKGKEKASLNKPALLIQTSFPESGKKYTIWVRSKDITLGLNSSLLKMKTFSTISHDWKWHNIGNYSTKEIGSSFSVFAMPNKQNSLASSGVDCIILASDVAFKPTGIYSSALGPQENNNTLNKDGASNVLQTTVDIFSGKTSSTISSFVASANAHGAKKHVLENKSWDNTMKYFFSDNLLVLFQNVLKKPNKNGEWWDFEQFDRFILAAKNKWKVKDLMILPKWRLRWENKDGDPTKVELQRGRDLIMQLVKRYGKPGPLYVKYWVLSDEWGRGYWEKNYVKFADFYASTVKAAKKFNPNLKIGGPVDCWPNNKIIAELLRKCPELDFIAWNMFISGRADMPLPALFKRSAYLKLNIKSSRELSKKILGRELPVMVSSYGQNYRAWSPPDYKLAQGIGGVWNALALNYMVEAQCFSGVFYNIRAKDCGLFGPSDPFARKSGMISPLMDPAKINIRPVGRVHYFFKKNIAGTKLNKLKISGNDKKFSIIATVDEKGNQNIVMVNFSENYRQVTLKLDPFVMPDYFNFNLPSEYLYCDEYSVKRGKGFFFSSKGQAKLYMPPFSSYCIKTKSAKNLIKNDIAALFHMDGRYYDQCRSGSHNAVRRNNYFTTEIFKTGTGALDCVGKRKRGRIRLAGAAAINGTKTFGIAFWVYRVKNFDDYGSIISFGINKLELEHVGGDNPDDLFQIKRAGFCKFGGKQQHGVQIPLKKWTHIAITADGKMGRIIVDGETKTAFKQTGKGLNAGNLLYLGSQRANTGAIDCYIDELMISAKPCGEKWAKKIFNATKGGDNYHLRNQKNKTIKINK